MKAISWFEENTNLLFAYFAIDSKTKEIIPFDKKLALTALQPYTAP